MTRAEFTTLRPGDRVQFDKARVGTVIRVDTALDEVVIDCGGWSWFRKRELVSLPSRGGYSFTVRGGAVPDA